jgi:hypothetical protein
MRSLLKYAALFLPLLCFAGSLSVFAAEDSQFSLLVAEANVPFGSGFSAADFIYELDSYQHYLNPVTSDSFLLELWASIILLLIAAIVWFILTLKKRVRS